MATIPSHHVVGDSGHTDDHNVIVDALTDHEQRLTTVQGTQSGYMLKAGGNVINLTNPAGIAEQIVIPAGTRDATALVKSVSVGGRKVFWLDSYGQTRVEASSVNATPLEVAGFDATQTADLQRWHKAGLTGPILSRVGADGTVYAPNLTPSAWTNLTLASGIAWNTSGGAPPQYRTIGDMVYLRGSIKKSNGSDFNVNPQNVTTLPADIAPPYLMYMVQPSELGAGMASVRMQIAPDGLVSFYRITASSTSYNPGWVSLDGIVYSRTQ